jgi:hypothetical protein
MPYVPELLFQKVVAWWQEFWIADFGLRIPQSPFRNPQWVAGKARAGGEDKNMAGRLKESTVSEGEGTHLWLPERGLERVVESTRKRTRGNE